jgi:hypothetical protein
MPYQLKFFTESEFFAQAWLKYSSKAGKSPEAQ